MSAKEDHCETERARSRDRERPEQVGEDAVTCPAVRLGDVCDMQSGGTPRRGVDNFYGGSIPWAKISDLETEDGVVVTTEESISTTGLSAIGNRLFSKGTILLAMYGSVGKTGVAGCEMATNQAILGLVPRDAQRLDSRFLRRWLDARQPELVAAARGVAQSNISKTIVENARIPLPPIDEQRRIADILDKADAIRRKRKEVIALTEELLRSAFLEMFGDPVTNPKRWPVRPLGMLGELDRGRSRHRPRNDPALLGGRHPLIQTGEVANCDGVIKNYEQTYSDFGLAQSKMWPAGTLCITIAANIAKTGVLAFDACFPDSVVGFTPGLDVTTEYIQYWMSFLQPILERQAPQVAQRNINLEILRALGAPTPPSDRQRAFSQFVTHVRRTRERMRSSFESAESLFCSLVARAFHGEVVC